MVIHLPLHTLSLWRQVAFSAALLERMIPNYQMFNEAVDFGDYAVIRNQVNLFWQWLDKSNQGKININAQLNKLEEQTPNPEHFDYFGVFPALDVCMAIMSLWQIIQDQQTEDIANVSRLSENSVAFFVELSLEQEIDQALEQNQDEVIDVSEQAVSRSIKDHPLMQWEVATQSELFDFIKDAPENKNTCKQAISLVLEEGLSNLGIEI